ncbi:MAG: hypothetical protein E4G95_06215 [Bacteroidia bacterium]|nr:MAG: hypothetical protein E4G95_06215 [Bacteroidia bacterium]
MKKTVLLGIIFGCLASSIISGQPVIAKKYTSPLSIDPLNIDIRDFRVLNTMVLIRDAEGAYLKGDYIKAAKNWLLVVNNNSTDCESYYNLSRSYAMIGNATLSAHFLDMAFATGYINFDEIRNEESFRNVRRDPLFRRTMENIMKGSEQYGEVIWVEQSRFDRVRVFYPAGYDPEKSYPLLVALHGRGDNAVNFSVLWKDISGREIILAIPEGPYTYVSSVFTEPVSHSWDIITGEMELMERADPEVTAYIAGISRELNRKLNISYTLLLGFSQGASYAYAAGIRYNEQFDGLLCFGGRIPDPQKYPWFVSPEEIKSASGLPVFIGHGLKDQAIGYNHAEFSKELLERNGYTVRLSLFDGGHYIASETLAEALDWFATAF